MAIDYVCLFLSSPSSTVGQRLGSQVRREHKSGHRLTNHRVTEVCAASLKYEHGLGGIFRESGCEDEPSGAAADNDVVKRLARDLVESGEEIAHGGCCGVVRWAKVCVSCRRRLNLQELILSVAGPAPSKARGGHIAGGVAEEALSLEYDSSYQTTEMWYDFLDSAPSASRFVKNRRGYR